jgi:hypothetical protein
VDAREASKAIERELHPVPNIEETTSKLHGAVYFTVLDCNKAFHQLQLHADSREITTFSTPCGLMRYCTLIFGLNFASEIFQKVVEHMVASCKGVDNYIDDFLVWGSTAEEHDARLKYNLIIIQRNGMTLNWDKCIIRQRSVRYRGQNFSAAGVTPLKDWVEDMKSFRIPTSAAEVASLLGLVNYCSKYIENFSFLTYPLRHLIKTNSTFKSGVHNLFPFAGRIGVPNFATGCSGG